MQEILWQLIDPKRGGDFFGMTEEQAQTFFNQYLALRDERLRALNKLYYQTGGGAESDLDFDIDSLVPLWQWARKRICRREFNAKEKEHINSLPAAFRDEPFATIPPLSDDTLELCSDIAIYFAEVLIRNLEGVDWKICKSKLKRYIDKNQPVLGGFTPTPMNPRSWITGIAFDTLDGKASDDALLKAFEDAYQKLGKEEML